MASFFPGGMMRAMKGTKDRLASATGIFTAAATTFWKRAVKPQALEMAATPSRSSWRAASI